MKTKRVFRDRANSVYVLLNELVLTGRTKGSALNQRIPTLNYPLYDLLGIHGEWAVYWHCQELLEMPT